MNYAIEILRRAQKALSELPSPSYERVRDAIRALGAEPRPRGAIKLKGRSGWRIRIGDLRVIDEIDHQRQTLTVLEVRDRKNIYR